MSSNFGVHNRAEQTTMANPYMIGVAERSELYDAVTHGWIRDWRRRCNGQKCDRNLGPSSASGKYALAASLENLYSGTVASAQTARLTINIENALCD